MKSVLNFLFRGAVLMVPKPFIFGLVLMTISGLVYVFAGGEGSTFLGMPLAITVSFVPGALYVVLGFLYALSKEKEEDRSK